MTKKILLLILALPLILMITIFTTTSRGSLAIDIPVTGIDIIGSNIIYLDLDQQESYKVDYTIYPTNASNKEVTFKTEAIEGSRLAGLEFAEGNLTPKSVGSAKVYLSTNDGGYSDSFIVHVSSDMLHDIESSISKTELFVGETAIITTNFIPANATDKLLIYESSNEQVATVDAIGNVSALSKGSAKIKVYSMNHPEIYQEFDINVRVNGQIALSHSEYITWQKSGGLIISVDTEKSYELAYTICDESHNPIADSSSIITASISKGDSILFNYEFAEDYIGSVIVDITIKFNDVDSQTVSCLLKRVNEIDIKFANSGTISSVIGEKKFLNYLLTPLNADVTLSVITSNDNVNAEVIGGKYVQYEAVKLGVSEITLTITSNEDPTYSKTASVEVVVLPKYFDIIETSKTYGMENIWTIGKYNIQGSESEFSLNLSYGTDKIDDSFIENIKWYTDTPGVSVVNNLIKITDTELNKVVNFYAMFEYNGITHKTNNFAIRCVGNGYNVYDYTDLVEVSKAGNILILQKTITDFGYRNGEYDPYYVEIQSTYDYTYYENIGKVENAKVKILIEFKNDVYGNGYVINAHNVTYGLDETNALTKDALFRGPLNFVALGESESSAMSVKGQDNICFGVYETVNLCNVELRGSDLFADPETGTYDLNDLNYSGTVVEALGDNINISYSRISNGRTGIRAFGDINDASKNIHINVSNTILSTAREFLVRVGSNAFVDGKYETDANGNVIVEKFAPYLDENDKRSFPVQPSYEKLSTPDKRAYDEKYIKTYINFKNCAFKDSGIFSIGIDSHFAGKALADGTKFMGGTFKTLCASWIDLAKTSYGAKVTFEEKVAIYDWKNLANVDSSSLIDINKNLMDGNSSYDMFASFNFDISSMVEHLSTKPAFSNILVKETVDGQEVNYVHGGVVFFGGGKNYGAFETINYSFASMNGYYVGLSDVKQGALEHAAGNEKFYFLLHDATTVGFLPKDQAEILSSSDAYDFVLKG